MRLGDTDRERLAVLEARAENDAPADPLLVIPSENEIEVDAVPDGDSREELDADDVSLTSPVTDDCGVRDRKEEEAVEEGDRVHISVGGIEDVLEKLDVMETKEEADSQAVEETDPDDVGEPDALSDAEGLPEKVTSTVLEAVVDAV